MNIGPDARRERLWIYAVLPAVILNLTGCIIFGAYYGLAAQQPELVADIGQGQVFFALYVFINLVEWAFAASILLKLRRAGVSVLSLIAADGTPWRFKWAPAVLVFIAFNVLFATRFLRLFHPHQLRLNGPRSAYRGPRIGSGSPRDRPRGTSPTPGGRS
jgi:predicted Co/Zn/Cd cation transporter (cation efflux family)